MSSQVFAYSERVEFKALLEIECKLSGLPPVIKDSVEDFEAMVELFPDIKVIVIDDPKNDGRFLSLIEILRSKLHDIQNILILTDRETLFEKALTFPSSRVEVFFKYLKSLIRPDDQLIEGYISFPVKSILHFKTLPVDLYVKLSEDKFIKRIHAHESIDDETIAGLVSKGIHELYFEKKFNRDFSMMLLNSMINRVEAEYSSFEEEFKATSEVFVTAKEIVQNFGLPPRVVEVCESVIDKITEDVIKGKDDFSSYLVHLKSDTDKNFPFRLIELTSFIASQMVDDLKNEGTERFKKIIFAAFFCDISLKTDEQIHLRRPDQLKKLKTSEEIDIHEHAYRSSEMVKRYKNAPVLADLIIKQHHGSKHGHGIPGEISPDIHPLSLCLLAAQELAYAILMEKHLSPPEVLQEVINRFLGTPIEAYLRSFEGKCPK